MVNWAITAQKIFYSDRISANSRNFIHQNKFASECNHDTFWSEPDCGNVKNDCGLLGHSG